MTEQEENKPAPISTAQQRFSDLRTAEYRQLVTIADGFAKDLGGWDEISEGQRVILGVLQMPLRGLNDIKKALDIEQNTVDGKSVNALLGKDFQKLADLCLRLIKEYYGLAGKKATKKRLKPIHEIIEGSK
jgi:hypothetical protein